MVNGKEKDYESGFHYYGARYYWSEVLTEQGYTNVTEVESRASSLALPRCSNVTERKHYFEEGRRICAKTGGGFGESITRSLPDLQAAADSLFGQSRENIRCRELLQNDMECVVSYGHVPDAEMKVHLYEMPSHFRSDAEIHLGEFHRVVEWCEHEFFEEDDVFFYHSDLCGSREQSQACLSYAEMEQSVQSKHLGSASWKKERFGKPFASERAEEARSGILHITTTYVQHLNYLPFGEPFVDQRISGYSERFRFTGKEKDEEKEMSGGYFASERGEEPRSGIQYCSSLSFTNFGAKYMDHELMTMWLSVDPMADKYPNISPYAYCAWNSVKLIDPGLFLLPQ